LADDDTPPGVPGFRSWRTVYWFVWIAFLVTVGALALFSRWFA
jgi:hypothetical protein